MMKFTCLSQDNHYLDLFLLIYWSRKWQTTPVFLPEKFHGQRNLAGDSPKGCKEWDMTEWMSVHTLLIYIFHISLPKHFSCFSVCTHSSTNVPHTFCSLFILFINLIVYLFMQSLCMISYFIKDVVNTKMNKSWSLLHAESHRHAAMLI